MKENVIPGIDITRAEDASDGDAVMATVATNQVGVLRVTDGRVTVFKVHVRARPKITTGPEWE